MTRLIAPIEVLEVDQWTSSGDVTTHSWYDLHHEGLQRIAGGDAKSAKILFGGHLKFKEVNPETAHPSIGHVWYIQNEKGFPKLFKTNYDSSD